MSSWRKIISASVAVCIAFLCCACGNNSDAGKYSVSGSLVGEVDVEQLSSNRFTQMDSSAEKPLMNYGLEGYKLVCENKNLALYIDEEIASVRIVDKKSGYVWGALEEKDPENLNKTWGSFANSVLSISYMDQTGATKLIGAGNDKAKCKYEYTDNGFVLKVDFGSVIGIALEASVTLMDESLHFAVNDETIEETGENYIAMIYFAPFLGSTVSDNCNGYIFVPDGSGALIRYQKPKKYLKSYSERVYGLDYAIDNLNELNDLKSNRPKDMLKDSTPITMPVFGITHGVDDNAIFGHITAGDSYAYINASPAGVVTDYNWATASFVYRQVYSQPTSKNGAGVPVVQKNKNVVNPEMDIYFLSGNDANYSGMARKYRDILKSNKMLVNNIENVNTKLFLDFVAADVQKALIGQNQKDITGLEYLQKSVKKLSKAGVDGIALSVIGWQENGLSGYKKSNVFNSTVMGEFGNFAALKKQLTENSGSFSLYIDPLRATEIQINSRVDSGITLSQSPIRETAVDTKKFLGDIWYLKPETALQYLNKQFKVLQKNDIKIDIDGGNLLYGEYLVNNFISREDMKSVIVKAYNNIYNKQKGLTLYSPNEYLLPFVSVYRNVPVSSNQEIYITDSVPFIQLVLSGNITLVAPYANENFYSKIDLLKSVEYNLYPSFLLTEEVNIELGKTTLKDRASTCFENWKDTICDVDAFVCDALLKVKGKEMLSHKRLNETVFKVSYENGDIYINYGKDAFEISNGIVVDAENVLFCEVTDDE